MLELIIKLYNKSNIQISDQSINTEMGQVKGSVLSALLFNLYLEEALKLSKKLEVVRKIR